MEVIGTIKQISPVQQITPTFTKRDVVLQTDEMYPQTLLVEFSQTRASVPDQFAEGQYVKISINLRGREWSDPKTNTVRYFTSISGWRIESWQPGAQPVEAGAANPAYAAPTQTQPFAQAPAAAPKGGGQSFAGGAPAAAQPLGNAPADVEDDLPF